MRERSSHETNVGEGAPCCPREFRAHTGKSCILMNELPKGCAEATRVNWQRGCSRPASLTVFFASTTSRSARRAGDGHRGSNRELEERTRGESHAYQMRFTP